MNIILWIVFGAVAGWISSIVMKNDNNQGTIADIIMGIIGSIVGGFVMGLFGKPGVSGFNLYSLMVAVIGAVIVIFIGRRLNR